MNNKKAGNEFEHKLCGMLAERGFWVHNLVANASGQPADIIAVRNGHAYLIDAKDLRSERFRVSRVENNQISAMAHWNLCGNGEGWLAIQHDEIYFIRISQLFRRCGHNLSASMTWGDIKREGVSLTDWCVTHGWEGVDNDD